jgi:hypothetical protein
MAWPSTVVPGQTATAAQYNALVAALKTWGGDVDAGNYKVSNVAQVSAKQMVADGGDSNGTPMTVTSNASVTYIVCENRQAGAHKYSFGSNGDTRDPGWGFFADYSAGQIVAGMYAYGRQQQTLLVMPVGGWFGWTEGYDLVAESMEVGFLRADAKTVKLCSAEGAERDLRVRKLTTTDSATVAGGLVGQALAAQSSAGSFIQISPSAADAAIGQPLLVRANGGIHFDNAAVQFTGGGVVASVNLTMQNDAPIAASGGDGSVHFTSPIKCDGFAANTANGVCTFSSPFQLSASGKLMGFSFNGAQPTMNFGGGATASLAINGAIWVGGRITGATDFYMTKSGTATNYFQILNNGQFAPDPTFYPATGNMRTQGNIYASGNVSGLTWVAHGSGASLAEIRAHMRAAKTQAAEPATDPPEQTIPIGAVNFVADADGLHVFGKKSDSEIWEGLIPWAPEGEK